MNAQSNIGAANGRVPDALPPDDAHVLTRKQWSALFDEWNRAGQVHADHVGWLSFDHLEETDADRVLYHFRAFFRNARGQDAYLCDASGMWMRLLPRGKAAAAVVRSLIVDARRMTGRDILDERGLIVDVDMRTKSAYAHYIMDALRLTSNHVTAVARQLQQRVMGNSDPATAVEGVAPEKFDNRNDHPVLPLQETDAGGAWDLTTGHSIGVHQVMPLMLIARKWAMPYTDPVDVKALNSPGAAAMRQALADRWGSTLISRLARHALGTSKSIDVLIAPANWGKSTLISIMQAAFPDMVGRVESGRALSIGGDKFSVVTKLLESKLWVFIDESGGKTDKQIHGSVLKTWVDDRVSVELKGQDREERRWLGTAIFIGYDYPHIDMSEQGMQERFRWGLKMPDNPMSQKLRDLLLTEDAIAVFRIELLETATALWQGGRDQLDLDLERAEVKDTLTEFIEKRRNPLVGALHEAYRADPLGFVPSAAIKLVLEDAAGESIPGRTLQETMNMAFRSAIPTRQTFEGKQVRGWKGIMQK